jgi:hypothetical protein
MGSLLARRDVGGRETWYGKWSVDGVQIKRSVGPKRTAGTRDGLTRAQAEKKLRELMSTVTPSRPMAGNALTMTDLGRRYLAHLARRRRKKSTTTSVESILRIWLNPFFVDRDVRRITAEDVRDLMGMMESGRRPGPKLKGDRRYGRPAGAKTVRNYIGTLSALLNFAKHVDLPGSPRNEDVRFLERSDIHVLADATAAGPYQRIDRALYLTAGGRQINCGCADVGTTMTCGTRSGPRWPLPGCRCGRCKSGWVIATWRRRSATQTTRRTSARSRWSTARSVIRPRR